MRRIINRNRISLRRFERNMMMYLHKLPHPGERADANLIGI